LQGREERASTRVRIMAGVNARIERSVAAVQKGHKAMEAGDFARAAELYQRSAEDLREILAGGAIRDERSRAFLAQQCDEFEGHARVATRKANEKYERDMKQRLEALQGGNSGGSAASVEDLQKRFQQLKGNVASEAELAERLKALGPSQFPDLDTEATEHASVDMTLKAAKAAQARGARAGDLDDDDAGLEPELAGLLRQLGGDNVSDEAVNKMLAGHGMFGGDAADDPEVAQVLAQARDMARYAPSQSAKRTERAKGGDESAGEEESDVSNSEGTETDSDEDDSDVDSDDSEAARRRAAAKKTGAKAKKATARRSRRRFGLF